MVVDVIGSSCTWFKRNNTSFVLDGNILFDIPIGNYKQIIRRYNIYNMKSLFMQIIAFFNLTSIIH
jgi:hypothetical protein